MRQLTDRTPDGVTGARTGTTLAELLVALVLFGIVATGMARALDRQARFHDGIIKLLEGRSEQSATHEAVAAELRSTSTAAGELDYLTDSSVAFRAHVAAAIVCDTASPDIELAAELLAGGRRLTRVVSAPLPGDTAWLFDEGASSSAADDRWIGAEVTDVSRRTSACTATPYADPVLDAGRTGWRLSLAGVPPFPAGVAPGSVVRVTRRARLALYPSGTEFALGWADWNAATGAWNAIQPLSGAFVPFNRSAPAASGVVFRAADSSGVVIPAGSVHPGAARLSLVTRSVTRGALRMDGVSRGVRVDSLTSTIALRNRP